ncbi:MAG: hypothetical protein JYX80_08420 [Candidatus Scalindua sediminis]|nr:hypothetical protein [Candidatus Scalindua sediminis]
MSISKFFCMLIAGLAIIGFTTIGLAEQEEVKQGEGKEAIESEVMEEGESASEAKAEAESKGEIQYGAEPEVKTEETETKAEEKE